MRRSGVARLGVVSIGISDPVGRLTPVRFLLGLATEDCPNSQHDCADQPDDQPHRFIVVSRKASQAPVLDRTLASTGDDAAGRLCFDITHFA